MKTSPTSEIRAVQVLISPDTNPASVVSHLASLNGPIQLIPTVGAESVALATQTALLVFGRKVSITRALPAEVDCSAASSLLRF